ncbi:hypothetical protein GCM10009085_54750 [Pseudomonas avellanae]|nr:hypothetical protein GCM10009085_54750 [Pseudomonas avellanae]
MAHIFMGGSVKVNTFELGQRHTPMSGSQGVPFELQEDVSSFAHIYLDSMDLYRR